MSQSSLAHLPLRPKQPSSSVSFQPQMEEETGSRARTALQNEHADWSSHMESLSETISNQMHQLYIKRVLGFSLSYLEICD